MRTKLTVATAIAGGMLVTCLVSGSAQATSVPLLKSDAAPGIVTLVGKGGGHGGGHSGGYSRGGGGGGYALRSGGPGSMSHMNRGSMSRGHYALNDRGYKNHDVFKDGGKKHYASKDRDHDHHGNFRNRHRVLRNGVWVWVYGPGYAAYDDDCYWLRRQAIITGSPYWWNRYYLCVGYDYY
jgi:hypothetical protein